MFPSRRFGIVHLGDLAVGYPWAKQRLPTLLEALGWPISDAPNERRLDPPPTLVVVTSFGAEGLIARHRTWLRRAQRILVVYELVGEDELLADPEQLAILHHEHAVVAASLGGGVQSAWWTGTPESSADLRSLLLSFAEEPSLERQSAPRMFTRHPEPSMMAPGPWRRWEVEGLGGLGAIARTLCTYLDRPAILDLRSSPPALIDLVDGARLRTGTTLGAPATISPDGRRVLGRGATGLEYGPFDGSRRLIESPREIPILVDPMLGLGAVGTRCWFSWVRVTADDASVIAAAMHDWPCGHEKQLYGYLDNDPVRIEVSDDGDAFLSIYDVDAIVGSLTVPRWRPAGPALVPDWPPRDPTRVLFTCPDWRWAAGKEGTLAGLQGDCRADAPVLALGPDRAHRYTLGLEREVWRIRGDEGERLGGPNDGYAVFDADHREVRRGTGRLLCGSGPWLWLEADGHVWREQVRSGVREYRAPLEGPQINAALPVPASGHAVLVRVLPTPGKTVPPEEPVRRVPWLHEHFELRLV
jgi:hypothetical protein